LLYGGLGAWLLPIVLGILVFNNGHFVYTLDDAYIHLAMSEGIHAGGYGINPTEHASASSSILFPYLLAWASPYPFHEYVPFALNVAALVVTVILFRTFFTEIGMDRSPRCRFAATVLAAALPIALNLVGLVFMGMEHSLQVMLDVAIFLGVIRALEHRRVDSWLPVALFLAPLVRYESLLISGLALIVLVRRGFWKQATVTALLIAASVGAFSLYLTSIGLSPFPNSISANSNFVDQTITGSHAVSILFAALRQFMFNLFQLRGPILFVFAVVFGVIVFRAKKTARSPADKLVALIGFLTCIGFLFGGKLMGMGRHEAAMFTLAVLILIYLFRDRFMEDIESRARSRQTMLCIYLLAVLFGTFLPGAVLAPVASNNIHEQQYQMHRLATEFIPGPVAVNDIGWVSYRNEAPVLDLWGLASTGALRARRTGSAPAALAKLVSQSGAPLIMIYDEWFDARLTTEWVPLARLHLSKRAIYVAENTVALYAPIGADIAKLRTKLRDFARTLPNGASLELY
jgi:hypothetical protein